MNPLLGMIKDSDELPSLPEIVAHINKKLNDPNSTLEEIARLVETDPILTGQIIKLSNSAWYSAGRQSIRDLKLAIGRLGLKEIRNVVYSFTLLKLFKGCKIIDQKMYWRHCLTIGILSQSLSRVFGADKIEQELAYTSGLMHDIGVLVYGHLAPESYDQFLKKSWAYLTPGKEQYHLHVLEEQAFDINHAELGAAYIREWWPVDDIVASAVECHHGPPPGTKYVPFIAKIVSLANLYCNNAGINNGIQTYEEDLSERDFASLGMTDKQIDEFMGKGELSVEMAEMILTF